MPHQVFICHSAKDKSVADAVCVALEAQHISCWIAPRDVLGGAEYMEEIVDALELCQFVVLIFSQHASDSPQVRREIERSVHYEKTIVPFRIDDVKPSRALEFALSNTHWLDAIQPPIERHLPELCRTVSRLIARRQPAESHKPQQEPPSIPPSVEDSIPVSKPIPTAPAFAPDLPLNPIPQQAATPVERPEHRPAQPQIATQSATPVALNIPHEAPVTPAAKSGRLPTSAWGWITLGLGLVLVSLLTPVVLYRSKKRAFTNELVGTVGLT